MNIYIEILKKYWHLFLLLTVLITVSSFGISAVQKPEYRSDVKLLVIQNQGQRLDAYTAARSAQTVGEVISKMVYTSSFFDRVLTSKFDINDDFGSDPEKRKKKWEDRVKVKLSDETGSIQISVYNEDQKQAEQIAFGIAYTMINYGQYYHGGGSQIEIKMVDLPITSEKTVRPNILLNTFAGLALGILLSIVITVLMGSKKVEKSEAYKLSDKV